MRYWHLVLSILGTGALFLGAAQLAEHASGYTGGMASEPGGAASDAGDPLPGTGAHPVQVLREEDGYRLIRHAVGTSWVPAEPVRICALASADELLSIGVTPVAHSINDGNFPDYLAEPLADVPWIPNVYGAHMPNMEAVVRVEPDLIITRTTSLQTYHQLSQIAPVVVLHDHLVHYRQRVLDVGVIVGRSREALARVAWYDAKVAAARAVLRREMGDRTMAVMRVRPRSYRLYGDENHVRPLLYRDLQVKPPQLVRDRSWSSTVSPEQLLDFDADYLIVSADSAADGRRTYNDLRSHPVWQRVPAVKDGRVLVISKHRHWSDAGILGRARGVDDVLRAVAPQAIAEVNAHADSVWREQNR